MAKLRKYSYRQRQFLNPIDTEHNSYIAAFCESSDGGSYTLGTNLVTIADCRRIIELEFFLGNPQDRKQSLAKANLLVKSLQTSETPSKKNLS